MSVIKGDFLGFTFNGVHSSELGITRISDGSRYSENLIPTLQDKTTQVPGSDGTYYHGTQYTQKPISFPIAFDDLSEAQLRRLKALFGAKGVFDLIFDENPYKIYKVKTTGTPNLKYVCFDRPVTYEDNLSFSLANKDEVYGLHKNALSGRVYKGEGQLSFVAYSPYAVSRYKFLDEYNPRTIAEWSGENSVIPSEISYNLDDWAPASRLIHSDTKKEYNGKVYTIDECTESGVLVYNAGDIETPFNLTLKFSEGVTTLKSFVIYDTEGSGLELFKLENVELYDTDDAIRINTKINLIEGLKIVEDKAYLTGTVYNKHLAKGDFFKFPVTEDPRVYQFKIEKENEEDELTLSLDYKYLYY